MERDNRASITLLALCITTALGVAVAGYCALFANSYKLGVRQFQFERTRELAQSGLEEALWALNQGNWSSAGPSSNTSWTTSGTSRTVTLNYTTLGHNATGRVVLTVDNYAATGPVWPTITAAATMTLTDGQVLKKTLQATTAPAPLFGNAIASASSYVLFSDGGTVDSWNSDPDNDPSTAVAPYTFTSGAAANYEAIIAGRDDGTHGVNLTQATVHGYAATFGQPVAYSLSASPPGRVLGPATAASVDVDAARLGRTAFVPTTSVFTIRTPAPASSGSQLDSLLNLLLSLVYTLTSLGSYTTSGNLSFPAPASLLNPFGYPQQLVITQPTTITVAGDFTISGAGAGAGKITIQSGGSLELFVAGDCTIGGNGIDNQTGDPAKCAIFCTSTSTSDTLQYTTANDFCGVIYCENKPIDIRQNATFYGALLSRQRVTFTAGATAPVFHYDTALRTTRFDNITTPYVIKQLTEP